MIRVHELLFEPLISQDEIDTRILELGQTLTTAYADKTPLVICVLNGSFVFAADLLRKFDGPCEITFVKLASYEGTTSSGQVKKVLGLDKELGDRDILIVEDIVDSGRTLSDFTRFVESHKPRSLATVSLLFKPDALEFPVKVDYVGFEIKDRFVVGYGLDYNGLGRNLPGIFQLAPISTQ
jgi:hypoxanthine phosphoribosyltransferase